MINDIILSCCFEIPRGYKSKAPISDKHIKFDEKVLICPNSSTKNTCKVPLKYADINLQPTVEFLH